MSEINDILNIMNQPQSRVPTTDEMDSTTPEERNALIGQCLSCQDWTKFDYRDGTPKCDCGGDIDGRSIQSQRTFNPAKAKKKGRARRVSA